jgi:hypothetical protein
MVSVGHALLTDRPTRKAAHRLDRAPAAADPVVLSDDAVMTVSGTGTSLEGDRWSLVTDARDDDQIMWFEVETPSGHHSKGGYGSPPLEPGMRLGTYPA